MRSALLVLLAACGVKQRPAQPIDWSHPPAIVVERATLPRIDERHAGGLRVVVVENHRLPLVSIAVVSTEAGGRAAWQTPGLATLTVDLIAKSVTTVAVETSVATEYAALEVTTQTDDAVVVAGELAGAIEQPSIDKLYAVRRDALTSERVHRDATRPMAGRVLDRILFASHPYEVSAEGRAETLQNLTTDQVRTFAKTAYAPGTLTLVIVGDADAKRVDAIVQQFASFGGPAPTVESPTLAPYAAKLGVVNLPGATTSVVLVGTRSEPAGQPSQLAGDLANLMLGGSPDARLDKVLHDKLRVTLGAGSSYWRGRLAGSWSVAASFPVERTVEGLRATLAEIKRAHDDAPTAADVTRAKATLLRALATSFETNVGATRVLERMIGQGLPADWYATYMKRLDAITPADVHTAASKWSDLSIVVVGDWQKLRGELSAFGLPVTMYEP